MAHRGADPATCGAGVAAVALLAVVGGLSPLTVILVGALFYCIAIYVASRSVEGSRHAMDRLVTGVVTKIEANGIEVKVEDILTGFIRRAELARDRNDQRPEKFAVGEKVDAKVTQVDRGVDETVEDAPVGVVAAALVGAAGASGTAPAWRSASVRSGAGAAAAAGAAMAAAAGPYAQWAATTGIQAEQAAGQLRQRHLLQCARQFCVGELIGTLGVGHHGAQVADAAEPRTVEAVETLDRVLLLHIRELETLRHDDHR